MITLPRLDRHGLHADDCEARMMWLLAAAEDHCPGCHCSCSKSNHFPFHCKAPGCGRRSRRG